MFPKGAAEGTNKFLLTSLYLHLGDFGLKIARYSGKLKV